MPDLVINKYFQWFWSISPINHTRRPLQLQIAKSHWYDYIKTSKFKILDGKRLPHLEFGRKFQETPWFGSQGTDDDHYRFRNGYFISVQYGGIFWFRVWAVEAGVFDGNRYFDVAFEYAKADPDDILTKMIQQSGGWREEMD